jgi:UDP-N-acetylglucosamine 1-carboxyvinyltransferase
MSIQYNPAVYLIDPKKYQMFIIQGQHKLNGTVQVSGSKNASLPILCASLLSKEKVTIHNVPRISDIRAMIKIMKSLGAKVSAEGNTLTIDASQLSNSGIDEKLIGKMRASFLLFGPVLARLGELDINFPGGCVLGKRSAHAHTYALQRLGAEIVRSDTRIHMRTNKLQAAKILMPEMSVTATENAVMMAVLAPGTTELKLVAAEPHVQDLCHFLNFMGAKISGIGTHYLTIEGVSALKGTEYTVTGDYLEAGTFAIAALSTGGEVKIEGIQTWQLDSFWQKLDEMGAIYELEETAVIIRPSPNLKAPTQVRTAVFPSFPTDLQAPLSVLLTQAEGTTNIFETLFEGRLNYLTELEKMGAQIEMLNPHQAKITGKSQLKGVPIASTDIRAGAAMVLAGLVAEGTTQISNIKYIERGYENLDGKLRELGAKISRVEM